MSDLCETGRYLFLLFAVFSGGVGVAGGVFAFISILGIIPRLMAVLHKTRYTWAIENTILAGAMFGCVISVFEIPVPLHTLGICLFGALSGIFVGCLAMALAETVQVIPILCHRTRLKQGLPFLIVAMALGKALGSFCQLYFRFLE